jgi:hypothetical protein
VDGALELVSSHRPAHTDDSDERLLGVGERDGEAPQSRVSVNDGLMGERVRVADHRELRAVQHGGVDSHDVEATGVVGQAQVVQQRLRRMPALGVGLRPVLDTVAVAGAIGDAS